MSVLSKLARTVTAGRALAYGAAVCVALSAAAFFCGVHLGREWEKGLQARLDVSALGAQIGEFQHALETAAADNQAAQQALADIVRSTTDELDRKRQIADAAARHLDRALAARPDLDAVRVGDYVLRAWNDGNSANDSGGAAGVDDANSTGGREADGSVPGAAAGSRRPGADAAAKPRDDLGAVPPVRGARRWAGGGCARARADRGGADCTGDESP